MDPNAPASQDSGIFGLTASADDSGLVLIPVPWDATTSYRDGTSMGPDAILTASHQLDLYDPDLGPVYECGIHMLPISNEILTLNDQAKRFARAHKDPSKVNPLGAKLNEWVFEQTTTWLKKGKRVGIVGGDHSVPFGALRAMAEHESKPFGILHLDAHHDLRAAYEGFTWSHASIFYNVIHQIPKVSHLVQVGIRDYCQQEVEFAERHADRIRVFYDRQWQDAACQGTTWASWVETILRALPERVWISFDIDGLDPSYCPRTGTPVPGGMTYGQASYLIRQLEARGKKVIGFDLNEVGNDEWDANVGMRLLYLMSGVSLAES